MTLLRTANRSDLLTVGGEWLLEVKTFDENGYETSDTAPVVVVTLPSGEIVTPPAVFTRSTGWPSAWATSVPAPYVGRYIAHITDGNDAMDLAAYAVGPTTAAGMPTVDDVVSYLREASWSEEELQAALNAEASAQRARCRVRAAYPDDLREALLRRVARNLSMRSLPLALTSADDTGVRAYTPGQDPEVRRLEAPYRRLPIG